MPKKLTKRVSKQRLLPISVCLNESVTFKVEY